MMAGGTDGLDGGRTAPGGRIEVAHRRYEPAGRTELTTAVIYAIAAAADVDPTEVRSPRLYDVVDVTAVENALFGSETTDPAGRTPQSVEFEYGSYVVTVESDGWIRVFDPAGGESEPRT